LTGLRWASFSAALDLAFLFFSSLTASMPRSAKKRSFLSDPGQSTILDPFLLGKPENYGKLLTVSSLWFSNSSQVIRTVAPLVDFPGICFKKLMRDGATNPQSYVC
jgi:hypothetical protein